jgi:hypothetical protein
MKQLFAMLVLLGIRFAMLLTCQTEEAHVSEIVMDQSLIALRNAVSGAGFPVPDCLTCADPERGKIQNAKWQIVVISI